MRSEANGIIGSDFMAEEMLPNTPGAKPFNFWERMREISMLFEKTDSVHQTMPRVVEKLAKPRSHMRSSGEWP